MQETTTKRPYTRDRKVAKREYAEEYNCWMYILEDGDKVFWEHALKKAKMPWRQIAATKAFYVCRGGCNVLGAATSHNLSRM